MLSPQLIQFQPEAIDSYLCARITDFIRLKISFHFETVMSHISRVEFLHLAEQQGYRTYLYFVSTVGPEINIARVQYRVTQGGHGVPEHKTHERYYRSMDLLMQQTEHIF